MKNITNMLHNRYYNLYLFSDTCRMEQTITDGTRHVAYANCGFEHQAPEGDDETQQGTQCSQTQGYTPNPHDSLQ
jgi:hypothetical protein